MMSHGRGRLMNAALWATVIIPRCTSSPTTRQVCQEGEEAAGRSRKQAAEILDCAVQSLEKIQCDFEGRLMSLITVLLIWSV